MRRDMAVEFIDMKPATAESRDRRGETLGIARGTVAIRVRSNHSSGCEVANRSTCVGAILCIDRSADERHRGGPAADRLRQGAPRPPAPEPRAGRSPRRAPRRRRCRKSIIRSMIIRDRTPLASARRAPLTQSVEIDVVIGQQVPRPVSRSSVAKWPDSGATTARAAARAECPLRKCSSVQKGCASRFLDDGGRQAAPTVSACRGGIAGWRCRARDNSSRPRAAGPSPIRAGLASRAAHARAISRIGDHPALRGAAAAGSLLSRAGISHRRPPSALPEHRRARLPTLTAGRARKRVMRHPSARCCISARTFRSRSRACSSSRRCRPFRDAAARDRRDHAARSRRLSHRLGSAARRCGWRAAASISMISSI